ncbi:MAG TPA: hypothetical protein P5572_09390 [Phycisphaerae bacterium]|nr:hypothetical protein [Phycisphaerales bacterium]HRX85216.1 hypothetical protein [Phycisphaerae bacterium]
MPETPENLEKYERRAPGWDIRCLKCGFAEPAGKYMIRLWATNRGGECRLHRCRRCRRLCCHSIEKRKNRQKTVND